MFIRCNPNEVIISHNEGFVNAFCPYHTYLWTYARSISMLGPEIWNISEGRVTHTVRARRLSLKMTSPISNHPRPAARTPSLSTLKSANPYSICSPDTCSQWQSIKGPPYL